MLNLVTEARLEILSEVLKVYDAYVENTYDELGIRKLIDLSGINNKLYVEQIIADCEDLVKLYGIEEFKAALDCVSCGLIGPIPSGNADSLKHKH